MILKKISLILLLLPSILWANLTVKNTAVPGGVAVLNFTTNNANPQAFYNNVPLFVQNLGEQNWQVLFGIPLLTKPGKKTIKIQDFASKTIDFEVRDHAYKTQHITLKGKNKKYFNPDKKQLDRIIKERKILAKPRKTFSRLSSQNSHLIRPVDGVVTSPFGLRRFYNKRPGRPHAGLDFAGDVGTPIKAAASGKVLLVGHFFFNGKAVFIDHGQGLISVYIHMSKIAVKQGQSVKQGDIIGAIGKTGRAVGAHLHFAIYLNQTAINPSLLLKNDE